jgi:hypothetical protein
MRPTPRATARRSAEQSVSADPALVRGLIGAALVTTVCVGVLLRWALAGAGWPTWLGDWGDVRHAHSHVGYYGVLFPLAWRAWSQLDLPVPGRTALVVYGLAVLTSFVGFTTGGYWAPSIVGSTVVLGAWIVSTVPLARFLVRRDWLAPVAPSVWLATLVIPGVAVLSARDDPFAVPLVRGFLTWLLLGVVVATSLRRLQVPAPPPWLHVPLVLGAGLALGPLSHGATWLLLGGYGLLLVWASARMQASLTAVALWALLGLGFAAVAVGRLGHNHLIAISGLHFAVLGPVLGCSAWPRSWAAALPAYGLLVCLFSLAILGPVLWPWSGWGRASAATGTLIAGVWVAAIAQSLRGDLR